MVKTKSSQMTLPLTGQEDPPAVPEEQMKELLGALQELLVGFAEVTSDHREVSDDALVKTDR